MSDRASSRNNDHRAESLVGTVVSGRYRLDELIALGGMGAVYRAQHVRMHKLHAIKVLHPTEERVAELVARFRREAIVGAHVQHPNIAAATDFGELDDGSHFLVTEFVHGATLHARMIAGPIEGDLATRIALQIALALGALHDKGILHRDLKPRNVMLADDALATVKVIDFGLAKVDLSRLSMTPAARGTHDAVTEGGVIFGTVAYIAPEAALGMDAMDARADLYALGVILYEMLAGDHLFDGSPGELFLHHRKTRPPTFAERAPGLRIHPGIEAVVMRLLAKEPRDRYANAEELLVALDAARATAGYAPFLPIRSTASSRPAAGGRHASRRAPRIPAGPDVPSDSDLTPIRVDEEGGVRMSEATPLRLRDQIPTQPRLPGDAPRAPTRTVVDREASPARRQLAIAAALALALAVMLVLLIRGPWRVTGAATRDASASATAAAPSGPARSVIATGATAATTIAAASASPGGATAIPSATARPEDDGEPADPNARPAEETARLLRQATASRRWDRASQLLVALVDGGGAAALAVEATRVAARNAVSELDDREEGRADAAFAALERAGAPGLDVLSDIQAKGRNRAQARADAALRRPENLAHASPALRIAVELRVAPCDRKATLFDRAVSDGDARALGVLETHGVACLRKDRRLMAAIRKLRDRLAKP